MAKKVADLFLYKWRYQLGWVIISLILLGLLSIAGFLVPGGISSAEKNTVIQSSLLSLRHMNPASIVELPYLLLQRASIHIFGVTDLSIKLPSLLLAVLSVIGSVLLLETWFRRHVAIIATIITITAGEFALMAQSGTPEILYVFWATWLLLAATRIVRSGRISIWWGSILVLCVSLSLYTPLSIYIVVAIFTAALFHPHLRYILRHLSKLRLIIAIFFCLVLIAPLGYMIYRHPHLGLELLGIPSSMPHVGSNAMSLLSTYFNVIHPSYGALLLSPLFGLAGIGLLVIGVYRLATTKYTAKSYIISTWGFLLIIILLISPKTSSAIAATLVPLMLLTAIGLDQLIHWWYRLFPRNPYARLTGLIPLAILITGLVFTGGNRYVDGYLYSPQVASAFSSDLSLLNKQLGSTGAPIMLVVTPAEAPFYQVVALHHKGLELETVLPPSFTTETIVSHDVDRSHISLTPFRIVTSHDSRDSDRFYLYKNGA